MKTKLIEYDAKINKIYETLENFFPNSYNDWTLDAILHLLKHCNVAFSIMDYLEKEYRGHVDDKILDDAIEAVQRIEIDKKLRYMSESNFQRLLLK